MKRSANRREFLGFTAATAAAGWAGGSLFAADAAAKPGPNDTINLGVIGCGGRCNETIPHFMAAPGVRVTAVCDVNTNRMAAMRARTGGDRVQQYRDFRKLLDDKNIDAVMIATTPHWHVPIAIHACRAGKDVYLEKPLGHFIGEGQVAIAAAKKYNRIVQIGTQQHSREHYRKAVEIIQSGKLGDICEVKIWDFDNFSPGFGAPANCDPPAELDWDFYIGPAPMMSYNPNCYANGGFDWFKSTGSGYQVAWGVHHYDIVNWALQTKWPTTVSASGGKFAFPKDNREWPDTFSAIAEFGPSPVAKNGFVLQYSMRIGCRHERRSHSKCFYGTEATLWIDRGRFTVRGETRHDGRRSVPDMEVAASDDEYRHMRVFFDNLRNRTQPISSLEVGHRATNIGHLMNVAYQVGRKIRWDGEHEQVLDDADANALVHCKYREPWKLEV